MEDLRRRSLCFSRKAEELPDGLGYQKSWDGLMMPSMKLTNASVA